MNDAALFSIVTLLVGWLLGRLSASVEKSYERRSSRNRLIFHLIELFEDIAKRKVIDDVVLSYVGSGRKLAPLRRHFRNNVPDESARSADQLYAMIIETAAYDPLLAEEVNSTLMPARLLDQRLLTADSDEDEFEVLLRSLTLLDTAMLKRLQLVSESLAAKNGLLHRRKIRSFFLHRQKTLKEGIDEQQRIRESIRHVGKKANQTPEPTATAVTPPAAQEPRQP